MIPKHIAIRKDFFVAARFDEGAARCVHRPGSRQPGRYRQSNLVIVER